MDERDRLLAKKNELEQLIRSKQESFAIPLAQWNDALTITSHLQTLNIELERINDELAQHYPDQLF